ncbi:MAG: zf-HC2 domain-containing protein [Planctomycetaceae bacterium]|nr:zf-HC2 domain-containing protein [Planctomycetaceae bacterium]
MADCGLPRPLLEAWLDGECSVEERNRVEAHLPSCGVCRDAVDRAALGVGLFILNDAPPGKAGLRPSEGFTARVMARIAADPARSEGVDDDAPPEACRVAVLLPGFLPAGAPEVRLEFPGFGPSEVPGIPAGRAVILFLDEGGRECGRTER